MTKLLLYALVLGAVASQAVAGPLHNAVKDGDIEQVKSLIAQGEDVNNSDRYLGWPLHQAAILVDGDMARLLVAEGASQPAVGVLLIHRNRIVLDIRWRHQQAD